MIEDGKQRFMKAFNAGRPLAPLFTEFANEAIVGRRTRHLEDALACAICIIEEVERRGIAKFGGDARGWTARRFLKDSGRNLATMQHERFSRDMSLLVGMLEGVRSLYPSLTITL